MYQIAETATAFQTAGTYLTQNLTTEELVPTIGASAAWPPRDSARAHKDEKPSIFGRMVQKLEVQESLLRSAGELTS